MARKLESTEMPACVFIDETESGDDLHGLNPDQAAWLVEELKRLRLERLLAKLERNRK